MTATRYTPIIKTVSIAIVQGLIFFQNLTSCFVAFQNHLWICCAYKFGSFQNFVDVVILCVSPKPAFVCVVFEIATSNNRGWIESI